MTPQRAMNQVTSGAEPTCEGTGSARSTDVVFIASNSAKLLGSGIISALALTLITSNRWNLLDAKVGVALVLFIQWQVLGLTLTKLGVDQVIFAAITDNPARKADTTSHFRSRTTPLGLLFAVLVVLVFSPYAGVVCFLSLLFDTESAFVIADFNARERYTDVTIASLLNYPLFFMIVFVAQVWMPVTLPLAITVFLLTSVMRWGWLRARRTNERSLPSFACRGTAVTGVAPLLNFLMFRADQVLLGTAVVAALVTSVRPDFLRQLLFMGRYQELVSGGLTVLGGILLPRLYLRYPIRLRQKFSAVATTTWYGFAYLGAGLLAVLAYSLLWKGTPLPPILLVCAALTGLLILPANTITYSMIRQAHWRGLIRNLVLALLVGGVVLAIGLVTGAAVGVVVMVTLQLSVFVTLALAASWLEPRQLHD